MSQEPAKNLLHGALIEAEILTSLFPMYLLKVACFLGFWWSTHGCVNTSQVVYKCFYVSHESPKILVFGSLCKLKYWPPCSPCICSTWPYFWAHALCLQVCQHLSNSLQVYLWVSGASKTFGAWGPYRNWDIDLPSLPCICSIWPTFGHWHSTCRCFNTCQVI